MSERPRSDWKKGWGAGGWGSEYDKCKAGGVHRVHRKQVWLELLQQELHRWRGCKVRKKGWSRIPRYLPPPSSTPAEILFILPGPAKRPHPRFPLQAVASEEHCCYAIDFISFKYTSFLKSLTREKIIYRLKQLPVSMDLNHQDWVPWKLKY